eukprot:scaffold8327_cov106-Isochrysis_galbana.AAC.6
MLSHRPLCCHFASHRSAQCLLSSTPPAVSHSDAEPLSPFGSREKGPKFTFCPLADERGGANPSARPMFCFKAIEQSAYRQSWPLRPRWVSPVTTRHGVKGSLATGVSAYVSTSSPSVATWKQMVTTCTRNCVQWVANGGAGERRGQGAPGRTRKGEPGRGSGKCPATGSFHARANSWEGSRHDGGAPAARSGFSPPER